MNDAPKVADAGVVIPEDLRATYRFLTSKYFTVQGIDTAEVNRTQYVNTIKRVARLEAENRQLKEQVRKLSAPVSDGWIIVEEQLPVLNLNWSDGAADEVIGEYAKVLIFSPDGDGVRSGSYDRFIGSRKGNWTDCDGSKADNVTHWKPLPDPPAARTQEPAQTEGKDIQC